MNVRSDSIKDTGVGAQVCMTANVRRMDKINDKMEVVLSSERALPLLWNIRAANSIVGYRRRYNLC
jgi:hypothetical protein